MRNSPLESLKKTADFKKVYSLGKFFSNRYFIVYAYPNDQNHPRLGLSLGKKVGKAVIRNKLRRRVREHFRLAWQKLPSLDIAVIARTQAKKLAYKGKYSDIELAVSCLMDKHLKMQSESQK